MDLCRDPMLFHNYMKTQVLCAAFPLGVFLLHPLLVQSVGLPFRVCLFSRSSRACVDTGASRTRPIVWGLCGVLLLSLGRGRGGGRHLVGRSSRLEDVCKFVVLRFLSAMVYLVDG